MISFAKRRARNIAFTVAAIIVLASLDEIYRVSLRNPQTLDGWLLAGSVILLTVFNLRKKIPVLPLLSAAAWLEVHVYVGITAIALFVMHAGLRPPRGGLETALWVVFILVAVSGVFGLWLSRTLPARIQRSGETVLYDRIPVFRARLAKEVETLARGSVAETTSDVIADFYTERLAAFMALPRHPLAHLLEAHGTLHELQQEIADRRRYLNPKGREILEQIEQIVVQKDNLDYQRALLLALRSWLFVHLPLTYAMLILIAGHVTLVYGLGRF